MIRHLNAIRDLRHSKSPAWTQADLALVVGCTQADISAYETGRVTPDLAKALAISQALGKTVDAVFFGLFEASCARIGARIGARLVQGRSPRATRAK